MAKACAQQALLRLTDVELVDLAAKRAQLASRTPKAPLLAKLWRGELQQRSTLTLHQASALLCSVLHLHRERDGDGLRGDLWHLSHRVVEAQEMLPALELLNAHALCYGAEVPSEVRELCGHLAKVVIGGRPAVARLAEALLALERLQVPLPRRSQQATDPVGRSSAVQRLCFACGAAPRGLAAAVARLWCAGAEMEELFRRMALALRVQLFWWRHGKAEEDARRFRERSIREFLNTRVDQWNRALWDVGVVQALQPHIDDELAQGLEPQELLRSLQLLEHLALLRAVRPPMWRAFMSALWKSREKWPQEDCVETVWLLTSILRRTPFQALVPLDLVAHATAHAGPTISHADPVETASMLLSLERLMAPHAFRQVLWQHQSLIRARLSDDTPAVLLGALARGGRSTSEMPPWWREEVLRPWGRHLRRLCRALRDFTVPFERRLPRAQYAQELLSFQLADLGLVWQAPLLRALGVVPASGEFARSAAREVLRQRRRTDTSSPWALRALGVLSWDLRCRGEGTGAMAGRKLVFTAARNMKAETDADRLLSVDLGYVERQAYGRLYRRHGDVERVALLEVLQILGERCVLNAHGSSAGTVELFVDRAICLSCLGVLAQFRAKVPGVKLRVSSFGDFARPPPVWRTVGRLLRDDALDTSLEERGVAIQSWRVRKRLQVVSALAVCAFALAGLCAGKSTHVCFMAFLIFEFCVGVYFPSIGTVKSELVPERIRATMYNMCRVPLNAVVVGLLLTNLTVIQCFRPGFGKINILEVERYGDEQVGEEV
ncbi:unnamed protein product [Cladocopium goreaui]|uniref:Molybdate-anion transporter n=1 Tax=Cladocopium goreaui TaxID=2562237 RepID=A0A9P1CUI0_9DINO|nr:unnamed protein product [Cladocopium goreaui]